MMTGYSAMSALTMVEGRRAGISQGELQGAISSLSTIVQVCHRCPPGANINLIPADVDCPAHDRPEPPRIVVKSPALCFGRPESLRVANAQVAAPMSWSAVYTHGIGNGRSGLFYVGIGVPPEPTCHGLGVLCGLMC